MATTAKEKAPARPRAKRTSVPAPPAAAGSSAGLDALTGGAVEGVQLERVEVDPAELVLDANARAELKITAEFKAMLAEHGVLVPLLCRRDPVGQLLVVDGQRRLVTALELQLPKVPVALLPPVGDDEARLWDQLVTNDYREPLTHGERVRVFQQLSLMGRSAQTIAKRTASPVQVVEQALRVAESKAVTKTLKAYPDLTIDQLAALADLEDRPEAVEELTAAAGDPGRFRHVAQQHRDDRDRAAAVAAKVEELPEGSTVLPERPSYSDKMIQNLDWLLDKPGGKKLTAANHAECPGHAAYVHSYVNWRGAERTWTASVDFFCTSWKTAGHHNAHATPGSGATSGPQSEDQKADRRALIANNKAADAAEPVRRQWLHEFLQRKTLPKDAASYVARLLAAGAGVSRHGEHAEARALLYGDKKLSGGDQDADLARPDRALRYLVALAASVAEPMPRDFWHQRSSYGAEVRVLHLRQLEAWGYGLSDVEQLALKTHGKKTRGSK